MTLATRENGNAALMERVVMGGDLKQLSPEQRLEYHAAVCQSAGLPPLTSGLQYITLNNRLVLYATKETANHLRMHHGISVDGDPIITTGSGFAMVQAAMVMPDGRRNVEIGYVAVKAGPDTEAYGNAIKKAMTQAYRRCTLGLVGLGMLDETEIETIPDAQVVNVDPATGEIQPAHPPQQGKAPKRDKPRSQKGWERLYMERKGAGATDRTLRAIMEQAGAEGFDLSDLYAEPAPLADNPTHPLAEWLHYHGHADADVDALLQMPWADWAKMFGDDAPAKARVKIGLALDIDDPLAWADEREKSEATEAA